MNLCHSPAIVQDRLEVGEIFVWFYQINKSFHKKKYPHLSSPNEHRVYIGFREFCIERIDAEST